MVLQTEVIPSELLRSFLVIERTGSYTDAAQRLGISQPTISSQMKRLQHLVGGALFDRDASALRLTSKGDTVKEYATRILNLNLQMLRQCGGGESKSIFRIGIQNVFVLKHLAGLQESLGRWLGERRAIINYSESAELIADVNAGYLDAAFVLQTEDVSGRLRNCREERVCWVCSNNFVLGEGRPIPLVSWPNSFVEEIATSALIKGDHAYTIAFVGHDLTTLLEGVRAGLGVCILPRRLVPADLKVANFHYLPALPNVVSGIHLNEGILVRDADLLLKAMEEALRDEASLSVSSIPIKSKKVFV